MASMAQIPTQRTFNRSSYFSPGQIKQVLITFNAGTGILSMHQFSRFLIHCLDLLFSTCSNIGPTAKLCFRISAQKYFGHNSKEILWTQLERNTVSTFSSYPILSSSESESGLDRRLASFATSTHFEANGRSPSGLVFKTARTKQRICRNQFAELK